MRSDDVDVICRRQRTDLVDQRMFVAVKEVDLLDDYLIFSFLFARSVYGSKRAKRTKRRQ